MPSKVVTKTAFARQSVLFMSDDENNSGASFVERGVSMDQDGKSNVWAIEPKMEVDSKSSEEKTTGYLFAGAGLVVAGGIAAFALANLPDPNQF